MTCDVNLKNRTVDGAVDEMCRLLKWAGIEWDEGRTRRRGYSGTNYASGPGVGGVQGPYKQVIFLITAVADFL